MDASDIAVCNALLMVERANGRDVLSLYFCSRIQMQLLVLLKNSDAAIVIQWSIYFQEFMVFLRHIAGEYNISAWGTCMVMLGDKTAWYADQVEQFYLF